MFSLESLNIDNSTNDLTEIILNLIDKAVITSYSDTYGYNTTLQQSFYLIYSTLIILSFYIIHYFISMWIYNECPWGHSDQRLVNQMRLKVERFDEPVIGIIH
jgi:hypothetical protein